MGSHSLSLSHPNSHIHICSMIKYIKVYNTKRLVECVCECMRPVCMRQMFIQGCWTDLLFKMRHHFFVPKRSFYEAPIILIEIDAKKVFLVAFLFSSSFLLSGRLTIVISSVKVRMAVWGPACDRIMAIYSNALWRIKNLRVRLGDFTMWQPR